MTPAEESSAEFEYASLVSLIATPERFNGHRIQTQGVATIGFEESALYLSREAAAAASEVNGVYLNLSSREARERLSTMVHMKWVVVEGVFHKFGQNGPAIRGYIDDISILYAIEHEDAP